MQRYEPRPPSAPITEGSRRHRRRQHQLNEQTQESSNHALQLSKSIDTSMLQFKNQNQDQKYSENELDSPQIDPYNSNTSLRRKNFFQSFKFKKDKVPLPRSSSACGDEKQNQKNRRSAGGSLRPARVHIFI
jgi:hypothetical protein